MYTTGANDKATCKISRARNEINDMLEPYHLYEICNGDCSPCEVQFSTIPAADRGLPSRVALRWLKDIKADFATVEQLNAACHDKHDKHLAYIKKRKTL
jgi:hypothetical protein